MSQLSERWRREAAGGSEKQERGSRKGRRDAMWCDRRRAVISDCMGWAERKVRRQGWRDKRSESVRESEKRIE